MITMSKDPEFDLKRPKCHRLRTTVIAPHKLDTGFAFELGSALFLRLTVVHLQTVYECRSLLKQKLLNKLIINIFLYFRDSDPEVDVFFITFV